MGFLTQKARIITLDWHWKTSEGLTLTYVIPVEDYQMRTDLIDLIIIMNIYTVFTIFQAVC